MPSLIPTENPGRDSKLQVSRASVEECFAISPRPNLKAMIQEAGENYEAGMS